MSIETRSEESWRRKAALSRLHTTRKTLEDHWPQEKYDYLQDCFRLVDLYLAKIEARLHEQDAETMLETYRKQLE